MRLITDHLTGPRPLHRQYPGQNCPQPAHVVLDCDADEPTLTATVQGAVGDNIVPEEVYYGLARRWRLDTGLSGEEVCALLERIAPLAEGLCAGWNAGIKDGHRQGFLTPEAAEVQAEIEKLVEEAAPSPVPPHSRRTGRGRPALHGGGLTRVVQIRFPEADMCALEAIAQDTGARVAELVRRAVQAYLKEREK